MAEESEKDIENKLTDLLDNMSPEEKFIKAARLKHLKEILENLEAGKIVLEEFDPSVVVALIAAGAASLSASLTYLATRKSGKIVIQGKDGTRVEVPEGTTEEELNHYIELANNLDNPKIIEPKIEDITNEVIDVFSELIKKNET